MACVKKIALIINASNFERQKNIIKSIHRTFQELGGYALYVFTSYGIYTKMAPYDYGEAAIYSLLDETDFDGCILEGNLFGNRQMLCHFAESLKRRGIPFVTLNFKMEGIPSLSMDCYEAGCQLMEHLIQVHYCSKINLVVDHEDDVISIQTMKAYKDTLAAHGILYEDKRRVNQPVSIQEGRNLYQVFKEKGILDADAVICVHDICALGLCMELEAHGYRVPGDMLLCSLNRSTNSMVFRPDITGADRRDVQMSKTACLLLHDMLCGREVPLENYISGSIHLGQSCGCENVQVHEGVESYREVILAKVEAGNQIRQMMNYNDALEEVVSIDELGENIKSLLCGINCAEFVCCLNQRDLEYIVNEAENAGEDEKAFDRTMVALTGMTERTGELHDYVFPIQKLIPLEEKEGDIFLFYPIHHRERVYGYTVFVNEYLPIELYNYRICHESIGSSIENLHRQMILKSTITQLDELHMRDALTGLYNRFAIDRFGKEFVSRGAYSVAMIDMDSLKMVNDRFGHLAGNHAICIIANVIRDTVEENDIAVRYGGDEFLIMSRITEPQYWEVQKEQMNQKLAAYVEQETLPYELGVSLGYAVCGEDSKMTLEECCALADEAMYETKKKRKTELL